MLAPHPIPEPAATAPAPVRELERVNFPLTLRVLCVDDNRDAAESLALLLRVCGAEVETFHDARSALAATDGFRPQVGILDVHMPGMDGCELAGRLRAAAGGRPLLLVALTGVSDAAARARTAAAGFDLHVTKPAEPVSLLATLANFMWWLRAQER